MQRQAYLVIFLLTVITQNVLCENQINQPFENNHPRNTEMVCGYCEKSFGGGDHKWAGKCRRHMFHTRCFHPSWWSDACWGCMTSRERMQFREKYGKWSNQEIKEGAEEVSLSAPK